MKVDAEVVTDASEEDLEEKGKAESKRFAIEIAIHAATAIAVIVGLWLVLLEMKESRENTFVEIIQNRLGSVTDETTEIFGENLADVLVRAYADDTALVVRDFWSSAPLLATFFQELEDVLNRTACEVWLMEKGEKEWITCVSHLYLF